MIPLLLYAVLSATPQVDTAEELYKIPGFSQVSTKDFWFNWRADAQTCTDIRTSQENGERRLEIISCTEPTPYIPEVSEWLEFYATAALQKKFSRFNSKISYAGCHCTTDGIVRVDVRFPNTPELGPDAGQVCGRSLSVTNPNELARKLLRGLR